MLGENRDKVFCYSRKARDRSLGYACYAGRFFLVVRFPAKLDGAVIFGRHVVSVEKADFGIVGVHNVVENVSSLEVTMRLVQNLCLSASPWRAAFYCE